jgi:lysophospholipase L1-like esterase
MTKPSRFERLTTSGAVALWSWWVVGLAGVHLAAGWVEGGSKVWGWWVLASAAFIVAAPMQGIRTRLNSPAAAVLLLCVEAAVLAWSVPASPTDGVLLLALPALTALVLQAVCGAMCLAGVRPIRALAATWAACGALLVGGWGAMMLSGNNAPPYEVFTAGGALGDEELMYLYRPGTVYRHYYPDDPRGYFHLAPPERLSLERHWRLAAPATCAAELDFPQNPAGEVRATVSERLNPNEAGAPARIHHGDFELRAIAPTTVRLLARSSPPRSVRCYWSAGDPAAPASTVWTLDTTSDWRWHLWESSLPARLRGARLVLELDAAPGEMEVAAVEVRQESVRIEPVAPSPNLTPYFVEYRIGENGFRDLDRSRERPPDVFRIAVLGDSFTFGFGVHFEDVLTRQLEKLLEREARAERANGPRFEVLNFGMPAYSTHEERVLYERIVREYRPDLVLLVMCWNDDLSFAEELRLRREQVASSLGVRLARLLPFSPWDFRPTGDFARSADEIERLARLCREDGARFAVVLFHVDPGNDGWRRLLEAVPPRLERLGTPLLDLGETFSESRDSDWLVHEVDRHPNESAHRVAAERIAAFLRAHDWIPGQPDRPATQTKADGR